MSGRLYKNGEFMTDVWTRLEDDAPLPAAGYAILGKARWLAVRETFAEAGVPVGLFVDAGETLDDIASDLDGFAVIAINFPAFTDGRGYSTARLLRDRHRYSGELRAVGDVLLDQIPLMLRVGFDTFTVTHAPTIRALEDGDLPDVPLHTQPAIGPAEIAERSRPWARRSAG